MRFYEFIEKSGAHRATYDLISGRRKYTFEYSEDEGEELFVNAIVDEISGKEALRVNRSSLATIVQSDPEIGGSAFTGFNVDGNGHLAEVYSSEGEGLTAEYQANAQGQIEWAQFASGEQFGVIYDPSGRVKKLYRQRCGSDGD